MCFFHLVLLFGELLSSATCCPAFCQCGKRQVVECRGNIKDIPSPVSPTTILLRLAGTQITELREQNFLHLPALLGLDISHSLVTTVHSTAFRQIPRLQALKLTFSNLSSLPGQVFKNLTNLNQLFLRENKLETIPPGLFDPLVQLTLLDLSSNCLTHLDQNAFRNLENLVQLDLGKNSLRQLPVSLFSTLAKLQYLRLYYNLLESVHPGTFNNVQNLLELHLFSNNISQLSPRLFWNVPNLVNLTLSRNKLKTIPAQSFYYLPRITFLSIYKNPLIFLPEQLIGHMPGLKQFYLYGTELESLPENLFCNMTTLEILSVSFNRRLKNLPKHIFSCLFSLHRLKLEANNLEFLHKDLFSGLVNLETLILNSNKLFRLPTDIFRNVPRLVNITLENNHLETLPGEVLSMAPRLKSVTLKDNPWKCTCNILAFAQWVSRMRYLVEDYEHVLCHGPPHLQNTSLGSLSPEVLRCWVTPTFKSTDPAKYTAVLLNASPTEGNVISEFAPMEETSHLIPPSWDNPMGTATSEVQSITQTAALQTPTPSTTTALPRTSTQDRPLAGSPSNGLQPFFEAVILEPEDSIVHHNRLNGWVYLWTLPPSGPYITFLVVFHVLLVAIGMALIVASVCVLYRLNQAMEQVAKETVQEKNRGASGRKRFSDKL